MNAAQACSHGRAANGAAMKRYLITFAMILSLGLPAVRADGPRGGTSPAYLSQVLGREVRDRGNQPLGSVSDLLVQMPSGKIVFVAVLPARFFARPKAIPPGALLMPAAPDAPLQLDIPADRWIEAPWIDWNGAMVIKNSAEGEKIYGFYQQRWEEPPDRAETPMAIVAPRQPAALAARYVSLKKLLLDRVSTVAWEQAGFVRDFLLDWPGHRASHALVSPEFTPLATPEKLWFAIPVPLLNPPVESDAITVNAGLAAFRAAPRMSAEATAQTKPLQVVRVPATERRAGATSAESRQGG